MTAFFAPFLQSPLSSISHQHGRNLTESSIPSTAKHMKVAEEYIAL